MVIIMVIMVSIMVIIFFLLTLWFCEIFKLPRVMLVGEMGVW